MNRLFSQAILIVLITGVLPLTVSGQVPVPGTEAPLFSLPDLTGRMQSLQEYRGKVVVLSFWATWCPPCIAELPALDRLHRAFQDRGFSVLAVSQDEYPKKVKDAIEKKSLSLPVVVDAEREVSFDLYAVTALPAAFLIDRNGIIVERIIGEVNWDDSAMRSKIGRLLDGKESKP